MCHHIHRDSHIERVKQKQYVQTLLMVFLFLFPLSLKLYSPVFFLSIFSVSFHCPALSSLLTPVSLWSALSLLFASFSFQSLPVFPPIPSHVPS